MDSNNTCQGINSGNPIWRTAPPSFIASLLLVITCAIFSFQSIADPGADRVSEVTEILTNAIEPGIIPEEVKKYKVKKGKEKPRTGVAAMTTLSSGSMTIPGTNLSDMVLDRLRVNESITPETTALFGETIDPNTGVFAMQHLDVSIPGNASLPVEVRRIFRGAAYAFNSSLTFGDWQLGLPSYSTTIVQDPFTGAFSGAWGQGRLCTSSLYPGQLAVGQTTALNPGDYWSGDTLDIPGVTTSKVLSKAGSGTNKYVKNWKFSCYTVAGDSMERIRATSPEGITYHFGEPKLIPLAPLNASNGMGLEELVNRYNAFMLVSKITDRFGNEVNFIYNSGKLTQISSNDGRSISLLYENNPFGKSRIKSISANGQTWSYAYLNASHASKTDHLIQVTRPDGRSWHFDLDAVNRSSAGLATYREYHYNFNDYGGTVDVILTNIVENQCLDLNYNPLSHASVTHPSGAKMDLEFQTVRFGRSEVPRIPAHDRFPVYTNDLCFVTKAVVGKEISQAGLAPMIWRYQYSQNKGKWAGVAGGQALTGLYQLPAGYNALDLRSTSVISPDGSKTISVFSRKWDHTDGQEVATEYYDTDGSTLLQRRERQFSAASSGGDAQFISFTGPDNGWQFEFDNAAPHENYVNKTKDVTYNYQNGAYDSFTTLYSNFNAYGAPGQVQEHNSLNSAQRYTRLTYVHDTANWLLNLQASRALSSNGSSYTTVSQTNRYAATHAYKSLPYQDFRFGQLQSTYNSYHPDGNLKQQTFNATNRWIFLDSYKRGKPQIVKVPQRYTASCSNPATCSLSVSQTVNNDGTVSQVTDLKGYRTNYQYDSLGRVTRISPQDSRWSPAIISYTTEGGLFTQTISQGNYREKTNMDGLLRPILIHEWDNAVSGSSRYVTQTHNAYNKLTFSSYKSSNSSETKGIAYQYDGLQRVTRVHNTVNNAGTDYYYQTGNEVREVDARGNSTYTRYHAWGAPEQQLAKQIESPEGITTSMVYNLFDNISSISQGGITESRVYNAQQRLCRASRPDTGHQVFNYNATGDVMWEAKGASGSAAACNESSVLANQKITYSYDNLGTVRTASYGDGSPARTYTHDNQGNLTQLASGTVIWSYSYNSKHLLESESLSYDGRTFNLSWGHNNLGHVSSLTYPGGGVVAFNPNALGQARQAGIFASAASYYPDGQLNQFNYGNAITRRYTLDSQKRPQQVLDYYGGTSFINFNYGYDNNDNVTSISDSLAPAYNLSLGYDGADRLAVATGQWGSGSFSYDALGNITQQKLGSGTLNYQYSNNRLTNVSGSQSRSFSYDSRGNITHNGLRSLSFNLTNQLTASGNLSFVYDDHNRLVKRTNSSGSSYHVYSQSGKLLHEVATDGSPTDYVYLANQLVAKVKGATPSYVHSDLLGSPRLETNASRVIQSNSRQHYQPFGQRIPSSSYIDIGFTGHKHDGEMGLTYMQQRYYDPLIGRFYSNDPVGFTASNPMMFNRYAYANNNPYKYVDPDGRKPGDAFPNPRQAAHDWGKTYNGDSIKQNKEFGSTIYQYVNLEGDTQYSYNEPAIGTSTGVNPNTKLEQGQTAVSKIHSHASYDNNKYSNTLSKTDIDNHKSAGDEFVTMPNGSLVGHDKKTHEVIATDLPSDPLDPGRLNEIDP